MQSLINDSNSSTGSPESSIQLLAYRYSATASGSYALPSMMAESKPYCGLQNGSPATSASFSLLSIQYSYWAAGSTSAYALFADLSIPANASLLRPLGIELIELKLESAGVRLTANLFANEY